MSDRPPHEPVPHERALMVRTGFDARSRAPRRVRRPSGPSRQVHAWKPRLAIGAALALAMGAGALIARPLARWSDAPSRPAVVRVVGVMPQIFRFSHGSAFQAVALPVAPLPIHQADPHRSMGGSIWPATAHPFTSVRQGPELAVHRRGNAALITLAQSLADIQQRLVAQSRGSYHQQLAGALRQIGIVPHRRAAPHPHPHPRPVPIRPPHWQLIGLTGHAAIFLLDPHDFSNPVTLKMAPGESVHRLHESIRLARIELADNRAVLQIGRKEFSFRVD